MKFFTTEEGNTHMISEEGKLFSDCGQAIMLDANAPVSKDPDTLCLDCVPRELVRRMKKYMESKEED